MIATVYVRLINEDVDVWRPVEAKSIADDLYELFDEVPVGEEWEFPSGSLVRCRLQVFSGGDQGLVAVEAVTCP